MRTYAILLSLAVVAVEIVQAKLPLYHYPKDGCCARGHTCPNLSVKPPMCKEVTSPFCPQRWPTRQRCRQSLTLLRAVYFRAFPKNKTMCCTVMNCPRILFSRCSYQPEKCDFPYGICTPRFYRRYRLQIVCPNKKGYKIYRYLPNCCMCRRCTGKPFIFLGK